MTPRCNGSLSCATGMLLASTLRIEQSAESCALAQSMCESRGDGAGLCCPSMIRFTRRWWRALKQETLHQRSSMSVPGLSGGSDTQTGGGGVAVQTEPILTDSDREIWETWLKTAEVHAGTRAYKRHLDCAKSVVASFLAEAPNSAVMWSGGKDSTALAHLVTVTMGVRLPLVSEKDDLDYPGELEYVQSLAQAWGGDLRVITPAKSPKRWIAEHASEFVGHEDMHSRAAGLSKECFYELVESATKQYDGILLGLRQHESAGRKMNRLTHGLVYSRKAGQLVGQPLGDWTGLDVYAYMVSHGIPFLPVYKCVALMDRDEPWRVRKSWWLPGNHTRWGGVAWLRHYWPSLFDELVRLMPDARLFA